MEGVIVALVFGAATAASGVGLARWIDPDRPPYALASCAALAGLVVLATDVAAIWRFTPWLLLTAWALLAASGLRGAMAALRSLLATPARAGVLAIVALAALWPLLVLPVPLDTDAQGFGMLALAVRDGGSTATLAPWRPDIAYLYSPGALMVFAAFSALTRVSMAGVMMGVSHATVVLFVWLAWDLGEELALHVEGTSASRAEDTRKLLILWPWATSVSAALSVGLWTALLDSHFTAIFGLLFVLAFFTALLRYFHAGRRNDLGVTIVALAAVPLTHADSAMVLALGLLSCVLLGWLGVDRPRLGRWIAGIVLPPIGAVLLAGPWLISVWPIVATGIKSPFDVSLGYWRQWLVFHGLIWPVLAFIGAVVWIGRRRSWAIVMAGWVALAVESSTLGWIERALPSGVSSLWRFNYPFSIAWHAPIIPYMALGGGAVVWLVQRAGLRAVPSPGPRLIAAAAVVVAIGVVYASPIGAIARPWLGLYGALSSANDTNAMRWIRDHTPRDARVLNYPGDYDSQRDWEAHWAPVLTERDCVYFRMQPFFLERPGSAGAGARAPSGLAAAYELQRALLAFWRDPADDSNVQLLRGTNVAYVLVPESIGDPGSLATAWRWQPPARLTGVRSTPDQATYLQAMYRAGGASVYAVPPAPPTTGGVR